MGLDDRSTSKAWDCSSSCPAGIERARSIRLGERLPDQLITDTGRLGIEISHADVLETASLQPCAVRLSPNASACEPHQSECAPLVWHSPEIFLATIKRPLAC